MLVNVTNASSSDPVYVSSFAASIAPSETVSAQRTQAQIDADVQLRTLIADGSVTVTFTAEAGDDVAGEGMGSGAAVEALVIHKSFTALAAGTADDVVIYTADSPFAMRILEITAVTTTNIGGSSVAVRTALAGGGTDLSGSLSTAATGRAESVTASTATLAKGSSLVIRRTDRGVAGEVIIKALRTA